MGTTQEPVPARCKANGALTLVCAGHYHHGHVSASPPIGLKPWNRLRSPAAHDPRHWQLCPVGGDGLACPQHRNRLADLNSARRGAVVQALRGRARRIPHHRRVMANDRVAPSQLGPRLPRRLGAASALTCASEGTCKTSTLASSSPSRLASPRSSRLSPAPHTYSTSSRRIDRRAAPVAVLGRHDLHHRQRCDQSATPQAPMRNGCCVGIVRGANAVGGLEQCHKWR